MESKSRFFITIILFFLLLSIHCSTNPIKQESDFVITDIDGNTYKTVSIGDQEWMTENLKTTHFQNGDQIFNVLNDTTGALLTTSAYSVYNNDISHVESFGNLYNGFVIDDERGVCPDGWHVPSDEEFIELEMYLGMDSTISKNTGWRGTLEGGKLKESRTIHWNPPNTGATNYFGFNAHPSGYRGETGIFTGKGFSCTFLTSSEYNSSSTWVRKLYYLNSTINRSILNKGVSASIRCVRSVL